MASLQELWYTTAKHVRINRKRDAVFVFRDGMEYAVPKERWKGLQREDDARRMKMPAGIVVFMYRL